MAALLEAGREAPASPRLFVRRLLAAVGTSGRTRRRWRSPWSSRSASASSRSFACSASDLDGPDIARELAVSLSTVRTHTKNIYAKLGVNSRRAAVRRAAELGLLSRSGDRRPLTRRRPPTGAAKNHHPAHQVW